MKSGYFRYSHLKIMKSKLINIKFLPSCQVLVQLIAVILKLHFQSPTCQESKVDDNHHIPESTLCRIIFHYSKWLSKIFRDRHLWKKTSILQNFMFFYFVIKKNEMWKAHVLQQRKLTHWVALTCLTSISKQLTKANPVEAAIYLGPNAHMKSPFYSCI